MNWSLIDPGVIRRWLICESSHRWLTAVRRFGPEMIPSRFVLKLDSANQDEILTRAARLEPCVILWEARSETLAATFHALAHTAAVNSEVLQIVACHQLSCRERLCLSPLPVAAMVNQPEELPRLTRMIHLHFARWTQILD